MARPFNLEPESGEKIWVTGDTVVIRVESPLLILAVYTL